MQRTVDPLLIRIRRARAESKRLEREQEPRPPDAEPDIAPPAPIPPPPIETPEPEPEEPPVAESMAIKTPGFIDSETELEQMIETVKTPEGLEWLLRRNRQ